MARAIGRAMRLLAVALSAVLVATLLAPVGAQEQQQEQQQQQPPPLRSRTATLACPPGAVPDSDFTDLRTVHDRAIECLLWYGIATGTTATTFAPGRTATRGQIATLLVRLIGDHTDAHLPGPRDQGFPDVPGTTHADAIHQLAALGVLRGFEDGSFRPGAPVQRGQLATLLAGVHAHVTGEALAPGDDRFADVAGTAHEEAISALAAEGIIAGYPDGAFRPRANLVRGQLASILVRHLNLLIGQAAVATPIGVPTSRFTTALSWVADASARSPTARSRSASTTSR